MVVFCDPGSVPENWKPVMEEGNFEEGTSMPLSDFAVPENLASTLSSSDGVERRPAVGYCSHCENGKPPRCHHCSVCKLSLQLILCALSVYLFLEIVFSIFLC